MNQKKKYDFRGEAISLIKLISSESDQLEYERNVAHVDITAELVCMWFDDCFHDRRILTEENVSVDEIRILTEFHQFYDRRVNKLPESYGTVKTWRADTVWKEVMSKATQTLTKMDEQDRADNT